MKELRSYTERDEWLKDKTRIGFTSGDIAYLDVFSIELYVDKNQKYYLFITRDSDEAWIVVDVEPCEN